MTKRRALITRPVRPDDVPFLWDMLWEAAAVDEGMRALSRAAALDRPENRRYVEGWGRLGDAGIVAVDDNDQRLGAAWYRRFPVEAPAYGFVAQDVPELAIAVVATARGHGIGTVLLDALLVMARDQGERAVSLSVDRRNPARALYERCGFRDVDGSDANDSSATMIRTIQNTRQ
jgi:GNAT superfamily N-acetyltransferase